MNISISDIAREIELKGARKGFAATPIEGVEVEEYNWMPQKAENYTVPPIALPRLTVPNRKRLGKVLAFIDMTKYKRYNEGATIMPIPTTNKRLVSICGSQQNASNLIQFMNAIGLVAVENEYYQYNANCEEYNKSKTYYYYYDNEVLIENYCRENQINKYIVRNDIRDTVVEKISIDNFDRKQVRFSSQLHLLKPDNYSVSQFEKYLTAVLYENYPELSHYQQLADKINDTYYAEYPELSLRFVPSFTWGKGSKAVRKIGIRCVNSLVSAKKEKDGAKNNFAGMYKEDVLARYNLNLEKDVKSSVPRITLSLNSGWWIPEEVDIYEVIYKKYVEKREKNEIEDTVVQNFLAIRESIKSLHMRAYFDDEKTIGVHTRMAMAHVADKEAVDREMKLYKRAVIDAEGGFLYGNEIFFHESCIYLDVLEELLKSGFFVWECYDAFYAKKRGITQEQYEALVAQIVARKATEYIERRASLAEALFLCGK